MRDSGMQADLADDNHPLQIPPSTPGYAFDAITYDKGGSVLEMVSAYMGEEALLKALGRYLEAHEYDTAVTPDLWNAVGGDAPELWTPWTSNAGHPYLFVNETAGGVHIKQVHRGGVPGGDANLAFPVPLFLQTGSGRNNSLLMKSQEMDLSLGDKEFYMLNSDAAGFYRVVYAPSRLQALATQASKLSAAGLVGLLGDTYVTAQEGYLTVTDVADLVKGVLERDDRHWVWVRGYEVLKSLAGKWRHDKEIYGGLKALSLNLTMARIQRSGWPSEYWNLDGVKDELEKRLRVLTLREAGLAGDENAVKGARAVFKTLLEKGRKAAGGYVWKSAAMVAVANGGEEEVRIF
jgi:aminopeptidase 2